MVLCLPRTSKSTSKGSYSSVLFEVRDLKRYIICIILGCTFFVHFPLIFIRTYFLTPWTSRVQPNALLASVQCMEKRKIWNMRMVWQQVLTAKRLERAKNAGKCVVIPTCVCPTSSVPADAFLIKYRVWRHLGRHQHSLRSHGRTNFEKNSPGAQHPWQTVPKTAQFHGT